MRSSQEWKTSAEAESALTELVKAGYGQWKNSPPSTKGGRPTRVFTLYDATDVDKTAPNPGGNNGCVNVNDFETCEDDWGEI